MLKSTNLNCKTPFFKKGPRKFLKIDYRIQEMVHESTGTLTSAVANIKNGMFYSNGITLALLHSTL